MFVLEDKADKVTYVRAQSYYDKKRGDDRNDYYDYLCYATGLLNTILTECKWKKLPKKITKGRECHAMGVAINDDALDAASGLLNLNSDMRVNAPATESGLSVEEEIAALQAKLQLLRGQSSSPPEQSGHDQHKSEEDQAVQRQTNSPSTQGQSAAAAGIDEQCSQGLDGGAAARSGHTPA